MNFFVNPKEEAMETDRYGALCEAVAITPLGDLRGLVEMPLTGAAHQLRKRVLPTGHGWGNGRSRGSTRPRGYEISLRIGDDLGEPQLVTWREIAAAVQEAWRPEFTELYDAVSEARCRLLDKCDVPIQWPRGVDHYLSLLSQMRRIDRGIANELLLNVAAADPLFHVEPQGVLW
jgi:hypothetical protein